MYTLNSKITIGNATMHSVHEVTIKHSVHELGATATLSVPVTALLRRKGEPPSYIETAHAVRVGDPVEIQLGYGNTLRREFRGYVKQLNLRTPLEIECEDEFYTTRQRNVTLQGRDTLAGIVARCGLKAGYCAQLTIDNFGADNRPVAWVLGKLQTDYGLAMFFDMDGNFYACEPGKVVSDAVRYRLRENTISDDELQFHRAEDVKLRVKAVCIYRDGSRVEATIGPSDGSEKTIYFYDVENQNELAALAAAELNRHSYDGYSGRITTFLQPFAIPTMVAAIEDPVYPEREGNYLIESTEVSFGTRGARREVEIGAKV